MSGPMGYNQLTAAQREWFEERAGILEYEANMSKSEAESAAMRLTIVHFDLQGLQWTTKNS